MSVGEGYNVSVVTFADGSQDIFVVDKAIVPRSHKKHTLPVPGCREFSEDERCSSVAYTPFGFADREIVDDEVFFRDLADDAEPLDEKLVQYRKDRSDQESIRRARRIVETTARANLWDYFVTLTFDPQRVDSFDYAAVSEAVQKWRKSMKRKYPSMEYVLVFEKHQSGRYHLHGLLSGCSLHLVPSACKAKRDQGIYNIPSDYDLGYTEVSLVRDTGAASRYISKYIGKALGEVPAGASRYLVSHGVKRLEDVRETFLYDSEDLPLVIETFRGIADRISNAFVDVIDTTFTYFKVFAPKPLPAAVALT